MRLPRPQESKFDYEMMLLLTFIDIEGTDNIYINDFNKLDIEEKSSILAYVIVNGVK